ncbi:MAG: cysteine synthase A [Arenicellales bacterium]|jgi:cysteine synthase A|nr:cysteine synthase A [Gammaproteobacteria bacterium]NDA14118.1 cysteine synthase A [Gammaproteobacteria bacterium]NDG43581.1 cysteine synthase A [Gammaproteobacteria bacterium]
MKFDNVLQTIGRTPVVQLHRFDRGRAAELWVKLESFNPGGSVKDRPALNMIEDAEARGVLKPGDTIVEPTSGNTGIGLAMVAAVKGYPAVFVMSADMSQERKDILKAYGAELVLTPAEKGTVGAIEEARRLEKEKGYFFVGQHYNPANPLAHRSTANEIIQDFGTSLGAVICTTGTGGTISGLSRFLRPAIPNIRIIATEPDVSPILSKGIAKKHRIMGTAPGFIPDTLDQSAYDDIIAVNADDAIAVTRRMAQQEGIFCGISCGAAVVGMLEYAQRDEATGQTLLAILADTGERYLSTELWSSL